MSNDNILSEAACKMLSAEVRRQIDLAEVMGFKVEVSTAYVGDDVEDFVFSVSYNGNYYLFKHYNKSSPMYFTLEQLSEFVAGHAYSLAQNALHEHNHPEPKPAPVKAA